MATNVAEGEEGGGRLDGMKDYFKELGVEWRKVTFPEHRPWPFAKGWAKADLWRATITVFVFTILFAVILSSMDWVIGSIFKFIFK